MLAAIETRSAKTLGALNVDTALASPGKPSPGPISLPQKAGSQQEQESRGLRVLVADDNKTNLEVLTRMLTLEKVKDVQVAMVRRLHQQLPIPSPFIPLAESSASY